MEDEAHLYKDMPGNHNGIECNHTPGKDNYGTGDLTGYSQVVSPPINQLGWIYIRDGEDNPLMRIGKGYWVFLINGGTLAGFSCTPI